MSFKNFDHAINSRKKTIIDLEQKRIEHLAKLEHYSLMQKKEMQAVSSLNRQISKLKAMVSFCHNEKSSKAGAI